MSVNLSPLGGVAGQFLDNNGVILSGGKIYTYAAGTTTPQATYTSAAGTSAHTNPIILDSAGRVPSGEIWLTDGLQYKFVIKTSDDVLIGTYDNIIGINSNFVNFLTETEIQTATAGQTVFTLTTMQYQPGTNNLSVFVDGVNQYDGVSYSYVETDSTTVTFTAGLHVGALVKFTTAQTLSTGVTDASLVTYDPPFTGSVATNVEAKLAQTVSVKDFGAVAYATQVEALTGTASNAAIEAAIAALPDTGGVIYFPGQYYRLDGTLRIEKSGVVLKGEGGGIQTGLLQTQDVDSVYVDNASGQPAPFGVEFHDLWFIGYKDRSVTPNTEGSAAALRIDDAYLCRISNCYFENGRYGIYLNNASDTFIENCFFEDQPQMLLMISCTSIIANNLKFISCNSLNSLADSYAIRFNSGTSKCEFSNLNITGNSSLMAKGIEVVGSKNQISNVYVEQGVTHGIVLTGATCSGNVVSNVAVYGSGNGLRLETSALNNTVSNIALSGNTTGLNVSSTSGAGNFYDNINAFSNTTNAVVSDTVAGTQRFVNASFQLVSGTTANRPGSGTGKTTGYMYFDTTINKPVWWLAPNWVDATGTVA